MSYKKGGFVKKIFFILLTCVGFSTAIQAGEMMTEKEAQERAQIVGYGGDEW